MLKIQAPQSLSPFPPSPIQATMRALLVSFILCAVALPSTAQDEPLSSLEQAMAMAEQLIRERQDPISAALERVERSRLAALETKDGEATYQNGEGPPSLQRPAAFEAYAGAVAALARTPNPRILSELALAASHVDAGVRYAAMTALREGPSAGQTTSPALLAARSLMLGDDNPGVRRQAFEAYCRWGQQDDVLALSQALGSAPGPVRDLAVREWLRIEKERSAR